MRRLHHGEQLGMPAVLKHRFQQQSVRAESHEVKSLLCSGRLSLVINGSFSLFSTIPVLYYSQNPKELLGR